VRERRSSLPAAAEDAVGGVVVVRAIDVVRVPLPALQHSRGLVAFESSLEV